MCLGQRQPHDAIFGSRLTNIEDAVVGNVPKEASPLVGLTYRKPYCPGSSGARPRILPALVLVPHPHGGPVPNTGGSRTGACRLHARNRGRLPVRSNYRKLADPSRSPHVSLRVLGYVESPGGRSSCDRIAGIEAPVQHPIERAILNRRCSGPKLIENGGGSLQGIPSDWGSERGIELSGEVIVTLERQSTGEPHPIRRAEDRSGVGIDHEILDQKLAKDVEWQPAVLIVFHLNMIVQNQDIPVELAKESRALLALQGVRDDLGRRVSKSTRNRAVRGHRGRDRNCLRSPDRLAPVGLRPRYPAPTWLEQEVPFRARHSGQ